MHHTVEGDKSGETQLPHDCALPSRADPTPAPTHADSRTPTNSPPRHARSPAQTSPSPATRPARRPDRRQTRSRLPEAATGTLDHRLKRITDLWFESVPEHAARMIRTAWALGSRDDLKHLNLRKWAHMLGFRGHFSTKTHAYSTTLGALRAARAAWHRRHTPPPSPTTLVLAHWAYDGTGPTPDLECLAAFIGGPTREKGVTAGA
ncbi:replication initiator [Streptomyces sp. NPDC058662]|uniref:replication initiator n=1 Tax=Streptomyces sp. NPDC058662 TaxID=3346583 RepID=UPI00364A6B53